MKRSPEVFYDPFLFRFFFEYFPPPKKRILIMRTFPRPRSKRSLRRRCLSRMWNLTVAWLQGVCVAPPSAWTHIPRLMISILTRIENILTTVPSVSRRKYFPLGSSIDLKTTTTKRYSRWANFHDGLFIRCFAATTHPLAIRNGGWVRCGLVGA